MKTEKIRILTVAGARPQFIKAAALSRAFHQQSHLVEECLLHTGQHYDDNMSEVFFRELGLANPRFSLQLRPLEGDKPEAAMQAGIEKVLSAHQFDAVVVFGDTYSTLAGAKAADAAGLPLIHIEAGLRSFNNTMPEENNRVITDHLSTLLFCPGETAVNNLINEGFLTRTSPPYHRRNPGIFICGDIMLDSALYYRDLSIAQKPGPEEEAATEPYVLLTLHRYENTTNGKVLNNIFEAVMEISQNHGVNFVIPLHPGTTEKLRQYGNPAIIGQLQKKQSVRFLPPVSYLGMIRLLMRANLVMTDSGGLQKEAYYFRKKCLIIRNETEWTELVRVGAATIGGTRAEQISASYRILMNREIADWPPLYGDGQSAMYIARVIAEQIAKL